MCSNFSEAWVLHIDTGYWFFSFFLISFSVFFSFWMIETFVIGLLIPVSERYNLYGRDDCKFSQLYPLSKESEILTKWLECCSVIESY